MSPHQNRLSILSLCLGVAFAAASAGAAAQGTSASTGAASGATSSNMSSGHAAAMSSADKTFVHKAAIGGLAEVELGKLAQQKGSSDQVKQFGSRMVEDHSKANDELKQVLSSKGVTPPTELDAKQKSTMAKLEKLSGQQFDRAYMDDMVKDHKEDVALFRKESNSAKDGDLKAFAAKTLPTLEDHLKMAQSTDAAVKGGKAPSR